MCIGNVISYNGKYDTENRIANDDFQNKVKY